MSEFLIITGMSGAGRSTAGDTFEDGGWFVIDNMPPSLITKVADLVNRPGSDSERVALVVGRGGPDAVHELEHEIEVLRRTGHECRVLYLDAADDVLVRRFEGTRRRHPLTAESVSEGIRRERQALEGLRDLADVVIDTTELNVHQLRGRLIDLFERGDPSVGMQTTVMSFGYKYGVPLDVDLVLDCRFLPNPHWVEGLRPLTGLDEPVRDYVLAQPETGEFVRRLGDLLDLLLPAYVKEGKAYLTVAVGCTGGRHRSVVLAEEIARLVEKHGFKPTLLHRDVNR